MAGHGAALIFDLVAKDGASPAFLKVAGAADKAAASTIRAERGMAGMAAASRRRGAALTKGLTLPLLGIAAVATNQAVKYEKSLNTIKVATDQTSKSMTLAHKGLLKLSVETGTSTDQLSEALYTAAKAGQPMAKALLTVKAAAQGAKAEGADLGTVANALTSVMASYGSKLKSPVAAMNMIVRGSGAAKTTIADFSNSLSNVVPVAASLGIGFDQVAGAIATMTQHGETAQHATENLRFLITSLAGQNAVAAGTMGQLGVSTQKVSALLGKKGPNGGLVGSLDYILERVGKLSHSGRIVVDTFKKSGTATMSLNKMLETMNGVMKTNSEGLLKGKTNIKDYTTYAKSLGGRAGAGALQFLALYKSSKGFSNMLRSGKGNVLTYATALQKMLGGIPGMNTALQLSGESAETLHHITKEVGDTAKRSGKDVLGFAETQKTAAFKMDQAKQSLHKLAVEAGDTLLPALKKVLDAGTHAFKWFDDLGSGTKKVVGYSLAIVAGLGPLVSIAGRVGRLGAGFATFAGASQRAAATVGSSVQRITGAIAGLGLAYAGTQTRGKGGAIMGALGGGMTGAAIGSFFGPIGTAVGGLAGAIAGLGLHFATTGDTADQAGKRARAALLDQKQAAGELLSTLESVNGAYGDQVKAQQASRLQKSGALNKASAAGIDPKLLVNASLGGAQSTATLRNMLRDLQDKTGNVPGAPGISSKKYANYIPTTKDITQLRALTSIMKTLGIETAISARSERDFELKMAALGKTVTPTKLLRGGVKNLSKELAGLGTSLSHASGYGMRNNAIIRENAVAAGKAATTQAQHGKSVRAVTRDYAGQINSMQRTLHTLGFNDSAVNKLLGSYRKLPRSVVTSLVRKGVKDADIVRYAEKFGLVPPSKSTLLAIEDAVARAELRDFIMRLDGLNGKQVGVGVNVHINKPSGGKGIGLGADLGFGSANGSRSWTPDGKLPPGYSTVGERGWELVHTDKRGRSEVFSHDDSRRMTGMPSTLPGFAKGTKTASQRKADAAAKQERLKSGVASAIGGVGQAYSAPFTLADVGASRVGTTLRAAASKLSAAIRDGLGKKTAAALRKQLSGLVHLANKQLSALRLHIRTSDLKALRAGLKGTVDDTRAAMSAMLTDLKRAGASKTFLNAVSAGGNRLASMQKSLADERDRLEKLRTYRSGIADTLRGGYDLTQSGSVADFLTGIGGATAKNKAYGREVYQLRKAYAGNKSGLALVNALAQSGQTATLRSLFEGSKSERLNAAKAYGDYNSSIAAGADSATVAKYGETYAHQLQDVANLKDDIRDQTHAIGELVRLLPRLSFNLDGHAIEAKMDRKDERLLHKLERSLSKGSHG